MRIKLPQRMGLVRLSLLAIIVGIITGFGAVLFRALIGLIHNIAFLGLFSIPYDASVFTPPGPWGAFIILVPVIGGLIVTFLITNFAPEARGHGVPEVMDAIYYKEGVIRPIVAVIKSLASAISIGTGAAVGREGPIIQIGAAIGSTLGQIIHMAPWQRITLVAAGAGAGIAATFNTPIGGVMFAIELMMPELSARTFLPVALATGTATFVGRIFFGIYPAFDIPKALLAAQAPASLAALLLYALLGAIIGLAAAAFVRGLSLAEDVFARVTNPYLRNVVGMLIIGVLIYALFVSFGHYYVEGVGYSTIQATLAGNLGMPGLLLLLFVAKLAATSVSLGSGASGGIFSPSLFMGATIGGAFGVLVNAVFPAGRLWRKHVRHHWHGRHGRRRHRRRHDRRHDDFRDDARLRPGDAEHHCRRARHRRAPSAVTGKHLHHQAGRPRPLRAEGTARQHVPGAPRRRGHGERCDHPAGGCRFRRLPAPARR